MRLTDTALHISVPAGTPTKGFVMNHDNLLLCKAKVQATVNALKKEGLCPEALAALAAVLKSELADVPGRHVAHHISLEHLVGAVAVILEDGPNAAHRDLVLTELDDGRRGYAANI